MPTSKKTTRQTVSRLDRRYGKLSAAAQAKVDELRARYQPASAWERSLIYNESLDVVEKALVCTGRCCAGKAKERRLAEI